MNYIFEIKKKDIAGRLCNLEIKKEKLETPLLLPVININNPVIPPKEIYEKFRFKAIITNAYIIYRSKYKDKILEKGIHKFLDFPGIIETDSGSYQMLHYNKTLDISNKEIIEFQKKIGVDIFNVLDLTSPPTATYEEAKKDLEETFKRIEEGLQLKENFLMNGAIQGGIYKDLRELAAKKIKNLDVDIYAIGSIVPYMINYKFDKLFNIILSARIYLPLNKPVHLFGLGHPLIMPLAVAIGADIFDSASYILYAKDDRILTPFGTKKLDEIEYLPYTYHELEKYTVKEIKELPKNERIKLLAKHNLWVLKKEIELIKNYISEESLWELVIIKAHSHYEVYKATRFVLEKYEKYIKSLEPIRKKSGIIYQGELTELRTDIKIAKERLKERIKDKQELKEIYEYIWPFNSLKDIDSNFKKII